MTVTSQGLLWCVCVCVCVCVCACMCVYFVLNAIFLTAFHTIIILLDSVYMCLCVCVCVCVCVYVIVHMHVCVCMCLCACLCIWSVCMCVIKYTELKELWNTSLSLNPMMGTCYASLQISLSEFDWGNKLYLKDRVENVKERRKILLIDQIW